jgi:hypothetical protein
MESLTLGGLWPCQRPRVAVFRVVLPKGTLSPFEG